MKWRPRRGKCGRDARLTAETSEQTHAFALTASDQARVAVTGIQALSGEIGRIDRVIRELDGRCDRSGQGALT
ncbi:hypothetical protein MBH78_20950 [Oceanimonas sp. NS1]|nr:hypothetical protein [Oceanimonas sp. NS1]